jgi:hypothetical protein
MLLSLFYTASHFITLKAMNKRVKKEVLGTPELYQWCISGFVKTSINDQNSIKTKTFALIKDKKQI